ncbi:hypothetical protein MaudCBS49596_000742 [Microsporum audouinii]
MASEVSVLTVQLPAEPPSKPLDTRQFTKLRFPSSIPQQQHHQHHQHHLRQDNQRRNDYLRPSGLPRGDHGPNVPRVRSREKLLPTPPGTPTQRYYRPRQQHVQSPPAPAALPPSSSPSAPRPISHSSVGSQYSDSNQQRENSSASSSPLSRTPVSASELDRPADTSMKLADRPKSGCSTHSSGPPKKVEYITPPLNNSHFSCYQYHTTFVRSSNALYPLTCMTCLKADQEVRWRCVFCCLRICSDCVKGIKSCKDRSLIEFMEKLVMDLEAAGAADSEKADSEKADSEKAVSEKAVSEKAESMNTPDSEVSEPGDISNPLQA